MGMIRTALTIRKIARLLQEPNTDDALDLIGLTQKRSFGDALLPTLGVFGLGVAVGTAVTLYVQKRGAKVGVSADASNEHASNGKHASALEHVSLALKLRGTARGGPCGPMLCLVPTSVFSGVDRLLRKRSRYFFAADVPVSVAAPIA